MGPSGSSLSQFLVPPSGNGGDLRSYPRLLDVSEYPSLLLLSATNSIASDGDTIVDIDRMRRRDKSVILERVLEEDKDCLSTSE